MKRLVCLLLFLMVTAWPSARADNGPNGQPVTSPPPAASASAQSSLASPKSRALNEEELKREAAAVEALARNHKERAVVAATGFIEGIVDSVLELFDVSEDGNALAHYAVAAFFLLTALLLRRALPAIILKRIRQAGGGSRTGLRHRLLPVLETPSGVMVGLLGIFCALNALKLSELARYDIDLAATICFSLVLFWGLLRGFNAVLDHLHKVALERQLDIAPFMPWIKKTLVVVFIVFGALLIAQSLGANVKAFLAGLGIGGLAFALAAQDTLANLFGSIVVALDQPFKIGEAVQIGSISGTVEDIGLRSTKIRKGDMSLVVMPNKTVATESINNQSRFTQRCVDQAIGLPYDTPPDTVAAIVDAIRQILLREEDVAPASVMVCFRSFGASSLDIWMTYLTKDPDFSKFTTLRGRINLAIMRAVAAHGVALAFPTQTIVLDGPVAERIAGKKQ